MLKSRAGFTLVEMVVALALTATILALVSGIALRQQRVINDLAEQRAVSARLREASVLLPIQLRAAAPADLREATDTSLELRSTIGVAIVCDTIASRIVLAPATPDDPRYASFISPIEAGDSVWVLSNDGTGEEWRGTRVIDVGSQAPGPCNALGPGLSEAAQHVPRVALALVTMPAAPIGLPLRVTRPVRYSLYHASDGDWYLGERDWSNPLAQFATIQPLVGPFLKATSAGLSFRYADTTGAWLPTPVADRTAVATIQVALRAQTRSMALAFAANGPAREHVDSALLTIALRNHP
jgi:prepilin-type N-terminal cleavage/methylation domain-containing protein